MISNPVNPDALGEANGKITRALLSVFDKTGIVDFARALSEMGIELISSGGTARALSDAGLEVIPVEDFTGANEVLHGRVKTLHPKIHAGILADRRIEDHLTELKAQGYEPIDMVVCNLYPFEKALSEGSNHPTLVENIDIGGPTLVRAAAKNADGGIVVVTDPSDYDTLVAQLGENGAVGQDTRRKLSAKAFRLVANYDLAIADWAATVTDTPATLPARLQGFVHQQDLRYGENPHQTAALYLTDGDENGVARGEVLTGKPLSYNNFLDMDAAYRAAALLGNFGCSVVKHTNTCGLAEASSQRKAFELALAGDPVSAFGSILGFNAALEADTVRGILEAKLFVECVVAPGFTDEARELLSKRKNLRLFEAPAGDANPALHMHRIGGGVLVQECDPGLTDPAAWECVTEKQPEEGWLEELAFAMQAVASLKSNAITVTHSRSLLGAGAGQMSRLDACEQALKKAGDQTTGGFLGSDAFFPFDDCVRLAHQAGIVAVVQPGGSKRDQEVIDACNELGMVMLFTGRRHFKH